QPLLGSHPLGWPDGAGRSLCGSAGALLAGQTGGGASTSRRPGQTMLRLEHYLGALARKPYAVTHAAVVRQLPEPYQTLRLRLMEQDPSGYREMVQVLLLHREFDPDLVQEAIQEALAAGTCHAEGIRQLLLNRLDGRREASVLEPRGPAVPV